MSYNHAAAPTIGSGVVIGITGGIIFIIFAVIVAFWTKRRNQKSQKHIDAYPGMRSLALITKTLNFHLMNTTFT